MRSDKVWCSGCELRAAGRFCHSELLLDTTIGNHRLLETLRDYLSAPQLLTEFLHPDVRYVRLVELVEIGVPVGG